MSRVKAHDATAMINFDVAKNLHRTKDGFLLSLMRNEQTGYQIRHGEIEKGIKRYLPPEQRMRDWNLVIGDKVQVIRGSKEDLGKVGYISNISRESNMIQIPDVNMASCGYIICPV